MELLTYMEFDKRKRAGVMDPCAISATVNNTYFSADLGLMREDKTPVVYSTRALDQATLDKVLHIYISKLRWELNFLMDWMAVVEKEKVHPSVESEVTT